MFSAIKFFKMNSKAFPIQYTDEELKNFIQEKLSEVLNTNRMITQEEREIILSEINLAQSQLQSNIFNESITELNKQKALLSQLIANNLASAKLARWISGIAGFIAFCSLVAATYPWWSGKFDDRPETVIELEEINMKLEMVSDKLQTVDMEQLKYLDSIYIQLKK